MANSNAGGRPPLRPHLPDRAVAASLNWCSQFQVAATRERTPFANSSTGCGCLPCAHWEASQKIAQLAAVAAVSAATQFLLIQPNSKQIIGTPDFAPSNYVSKL